MIKNRIERFRKELSQKGIDGFLVMSPENRRYLSGFTGTSGTLFITEKHCFLFTDFRYMEQARLQATEYEIIKHGFPLLDSIKKVVERLPVKTLGVEGNYITYNQFQEIQNTLNNIEISPQEGIIENLRMIKQEEEIEYIKKAAEIADQAFTYIIDKIKPGMKEVEVAAELEFFMRTKEASKTSFDTIVASGWRSALPHGVASEKVIEKGEFITIDFGCVYKGYCSDMTRTIIIDKPDEKQKEIYEIVLEAQLKALEKVKAGLTAKELDSISRDFITDKGYANYFEHGLGHGLGMAVHENPSLSPKNSTELKPNMVITIEPGIYLPQWGGVRIEDLIVVKEEGHLNLTRSPKELITI